MAVLVFAEHIEGKFHKPAFEAVTYAYDTAQKMGTTVNAVVIGSAGEAELKKIGEYGAAKVFHAADARLKDYSAKAYAKVMEQAIAQSGAEVIVMSSTFNGRSLAPRLAARIKAGLVTNVVRLPETGSGFTVRKSVYSGKGFGDFRIN